MGGVPNQKLADFGGTCAGFSKTGGGVAQDEDLRRTQPDFVEQPRICWPPPRFGGLRGNWAWPRPGPARINECNATRTQHIQRRTPILHQHATRATPTTTNPRHHRSRSTLRWKSTAKVSQHARHTHTTYTTTHADLTSTRHKHKTEPHRMKNSDVPPE